MCLSGSRRKLEKITLCGASLFVLTRNCTDNQNNENGMGGECGTYGKKRSAIRFLMLGPVGRNVLGKCRSRW